MEMAGLTRIIGTGNGLVRRCLVCRQALDGDRRQIYCSSACKMRRVRELAALAAGKTWRTACARCGESLPGHYRGRMYCGDVCKVAAFRARRRSGCNDARSALAAAATYVCHRDQPT
jgi:hypothetical protein